MKAIVHPGDDLKAAEDCFACQDPENRETLAMLTGVLAGRLGNTDCPFATKNLKREWLWGWRIGNNATKSDLLI